MVISCYPETKHPIEQKDTLIMTPLIYLLNIQVKIQPFNHQKRHPNNINDIKTPQISQDYDALVQNVIAPPESPAKVFMKVNSSQ